MTLVIDTTRGTRIRLGLLAQKYWTIDREFERPGSHLVPLLDEFLRARNARVRSLVGIIVATGPGPYSSLRAGVAVANSLGYALKIPVVGVSGAWPMRELLKRGSRALRRAKPGAIVSPKYGRAPNITPSRRR